MFFRCVALLWTFFTVVPLFCQFGTTVEVRAPGEPGTLVVVTREEIESSPAVDLQGLINLYLPDVLSLRAPFGVQADLQGRGAGYEGIRVYLDGIPLNDPQTGHFTLDLPVDLDSVERVEYTPGGWAFSPSGPIPGGAVRIVTRSSASHEARILAGDHNLAMGYMETGFAGESFSSAFSLSRTVHGGWSYGTELSRDVLGLRGQAGKWKWMAGMEDKSFGALNFYTTAYPYQKESTSTTVGSVSGTILGANLQVYTRRHTDDFFLDRRNPEGYRNRHTTLRTGANLSGTERSVAWQMYGFSESITDSPLGDHDRNRAGGTLAWTRTFGKKNLSLSLGLEGGSGTMLLLPSLSVERTMDLISTSFTLRRGSRLPSFTELYYASPANLGNPNLESPDMVEAEWNVAGKNWTVSLWGRHHSDEIEWVSDDGRATFHAVNLEPFFSAGLEFRIRLGTVTVFAAARDVDAPLPPDRLKYLSDYSALEAGGLVHFRFSQVRGTLSARWEDPETLDSRFLADLRVLCNWKDITFFLDIQNLTNTSYQDRLDIAMPGRWISSGLQIPLTGE